MIYYHGSPIGGLNVLIPHEDQRTGICGVFVSNEPIGPSMFSLLSSRYDSEIQYTTDSGVLIRGNVITSKPLNDYGYLYQIQSDIEPHTNRYGDVYFTQSMPCELVKIVSKEEVMELGWHVLIR